MISRSASAPRVLLIGVDAMAALALVVVLSDAQFGSGWQATWRQLFAEPVALAVRCSSPSSSD